MIEIISVGAEMQHEDGRTDRDILALRISFYAF